MALATTVTPKMSVRATLERLSLNAKGKCLAQGNMSCLLTSVQIYSGRCISNATYTDACGSYSYRLAGYPPLPSPTQPSTPQHNLDDDIYCNAVLSNLDFSQVPDYTFPSQQPRSLFDAAVQYYCFPPPADILKLGLPAAPFRYPVNLAMAFDRNVAIPRPTCPPGAPTSIQLTTPPSRPTTANRSAAAPGSAGTRRS